MVSMGKLVVLDIGEADFERGFAIVLRIGDAGKPHTVEFQKRFPAPPAPELPKRYYQWQAVYGCQEQSRIKVIRALQGSWSNDCRAAADAFQKSLQDWLNQPAMRDLRERILVKVGENEPALLIVQTQDPLLRRLPWHLWELLNEHPQLEIALSAQHIQSSRRLHNPVRILAVLGDSTGINVQADQTALNKLLNANLKFLIEPTRQELHEYLSEGPWDILFFAGHSHSHADAASGQVYINEHDRLPLKELSNAIDTAVRKGLKLAIFNSCDGLGLAQVLADLHVPHMIVMREPVPDRVAQAFLRYFLNHFARGESFYLSVRKAREQLQGLEKDIPCASWLPVICQNPAAAELKYPQWNRTKLLKRTAVATLAGLAVSLGGWKVWQEFDLRSRLSAGERILVQSVRTDAKAAGTSAMFWKNYPVAVQRFADSLQQTRDDPEALIYLNNARTGNRPSLKLAVAVPIGSNPNVAQEILRGVAQAQEELNRQGGVNGLPIWVELANDDNQPEMAKRIADRWVGDRAVLAVIGHNSSDASVAAADVYQPGNLVMVTPTSESSKLTERTDRVDGKNYIFRTILSANIRSNVLANYAKTIGKTRIAICRDSKAVDQSSTQAFEEAVSRNGGKILNIGCDLAAANLQPETVIREAINAKADSLMLSPHVDRMQSAIAVARANRGRLPLFANSSLFTLKTLEAGDATRGIVLAVGWHPDMFPGNSFPKRAHDLWGNQTSVTWRTAMAYDATQVIAEGLRWQTPTREGIQQALSDDNFSIHGATGTVQFLQSGDRTGRAVVVTVESNPNAATGNSFNILTPVAHRLSTGERILISITPNKEAGARAFAQGNYATAIAKFQASLQVNPNDPETRIYLNNAKAATAEPFLKIATSVPIGSNLNVAQEILRGVAQAQEEINRRGGIHGKRLQVAIANDNNNPSIAHEIATVLVNDAQILAVVGHNSSEASVAAAPVYEQSGLVMITPTSFSDKLSSIGTHIFRMVPSIRFTADQLAAHWVQSVPNAKVAICSDALAVDNDSFQNQFTNAILNQGRIFIKEPCDFSDPNFNPNRAIASVVRQGANTLLLAPHVDRIDKAIATARANQGQLALLGSPTLFTAQTLSGQEAVRGLVLAAPWHPTVRPGNPFPHHAAKLWGGPVNWRTAMAYDATWAIATGLQEHPTRQNLRDTLRHPTFSVQGATGLVQFIPSGERQIVPELGMLLKIQPAPGNAARYDFVPLASEF
ncbi:MAG: ABC transporter substrate-binding protein [Leptolyngbyaceae cyanobacterium RU_5_1]|nr:ABC transporter substrate-binding protein [Leptolyngbyaceae cyanobacterium RU_5_1]